MNDFDSTLKPHTMGFTILKNSEHGAYGAPNGCEILNPENFPTLVHDYLKRERHEFHLPVFLNILRNREYDFPGQQFLYIPDSNNSYSVDPCENRRKDLLETRKIETTISKTER